MTRAWLRVWRVTAVFVVVVTSGMLSSAVPAGAASRSSDSDAASQLAERYAPIVVVRDHPIACGPGEPYLPTSVDSVLGKQDVVLHGPNREVINAPTAADVDGKGAGWYLDLPGNPLSPGCDYEHWFANTSSNQPATVYAHVAKDSLHPGKLALQYWFFWVFNDWNDKHEGDWEMIQLVFDADTPEEALTTAPISTAFAQHEGAETAQWNDSKIVRLGDHVVVYPSEGSHATYYTQAQWFGKSGSAGFGCDNTLAKGVVVRPEVVLLPDSPRPNAEWIGFTGRWGENAPSFNNGPTGPNMKERWTQPVQWQDDYGREAAVALPPVGGPAVDSFCAITAAASSFFIAFLDHPLLTSAGILAVLLIVAWLIRATRWKHSTPAVLDRERRAGQVVTASCIVLTRHLRRLWPILLVVATAAAATLALQQLALRRRPSDDITDVNGLGSSLLAWVVAIVSVCALAPVISVALAATARVVDAIARGAPPRPWRAIGDSIRHPAAALAQLLVFGVVTLLALSLYLLPVAIVLIALWAVAMPAAAAEHWGIRAALRRSRHLTKGRRWRAVLLSSVLVWIGYSVPGLLGGVVLLSTGLPFWFSNAVSIAASAVLLPLSAVGLTLQFYDFRCEATRDRERSESVPA